jgi:dipeptidyl aminopeptidase/acylaminoacyl peptidase
LTPFDNELHASNLYATPILAQHGTEDDNVPVYHSRRLVEVTNAWSKQAR